MHKEEMADGNRILWSEAGRGGCEKEDLCLSVNQVSEAARKVRKLHEKADSANFTKPSD
jgi:hypothetical protein